MSKEFPMHPMALDFISRVDRNFDKLIPSEVKVVNYLKKIVGKQRINLSISELAKKIESSDSTISKVSRKLDYAGFSELKLVFAQSAQSVRTLELNYGKDFNDEDSSSVTSRKLSDLFSSSILSIHSELQFDLFENCLNQLQAAKRIIFMGTSGSYAACERASHLFTFIGKNAHAISNFQDLILKTLKLDANSVLVGLSSSVNNQSVVDGLKEAKNKGAKTIAITSDKNSEIATTAETTLLTWNASFNSEVEYGSSQEGFIGQIFIIELLYLCLFHRDLPTARKNLSRISNTLSKNL